jgi:iron complex outermembrane receptor protein
MNTAYRLSACTAALAAALAVSSAALAQDDDRDVASPVSSVTADDIESIDTANQIVVQAEIGFRNRSEATEPVLVYDEEYFQRFEPLTAGDALKRVPSVTFLSDVIESDGPRMRGLDSGYTQILINGDKVPGPNPDRSFFLDRIPAELIERVEIVRSSSARRTGDAVAGTLNIVLRDAFALDGGYVKGGGLLFDDGEIKPTFGAYYGGELGPGRILLGANVQGRYNPKLKESLRFGDSPENNPNFFDDDFDNREDQTDTRDGWDYAFNGSYGIEGETTEFELNGNYVRTDRTETERSFEYNVLTGTPGPVDDEDDDEGLLTDNDNVSEIDQENWGVGAKLKQEWSLGETSLKASFARFKDDRDEVETEIDFETDPGDDPEWESELTLSRNRDEELSLAFEHEFPATMNSNFVVGAFWQDKDRHADIAVFEQDDELDGRDWDQFSDTPAVLPVDADYEFEEDGSVLSDIEERRFDLFALVEGAADNVSWEIGIRWENTELSVDDLFAVPGEPEAETDYDYLLPSASLKIDTGDGRITASVARTVRRPQFDFLFVGALEEELGDHDLRGNPFLVPEKAWGADLGYEHRLGSNGVIGVNVFYRTISDLIEIANTGEVRIEDEGTEDEEEFLILQPQNVGEGEVYGVEFDLSADLAFLGLPDTGVFGNVSWLDSEIEDMLGERRFNSQSKFVYNFGFIQNLRDLAAAFGATYRKQGRAFGRIVAEEVTTTYGADLEVFVEKRFGDNFTIRAVGSNLLDGKKREIFNKFDTIDDQIDRDFDEYELESERAGPVFQLVGRYAF